MSDRPVATRFLAWLLAVFVSGFAAPVSAQPFPCDGSIYQVQSGQLRIFDPITSTYLNVGPRTSSYNAAAFNVTDNYAYAIQNRWVIRINADGTVERVYNVGFSSFSGDIDYANNFYVRRSHTRYTRIDLATGARTDVDFSGPNGGPADVAYFQSGGQEFLIGFAGGGTMYRYNITTRTKENISVPGLPGGGYGAAWTDSNGRFFTFNNTTGLLFEVFDYFTSSPTFVQVGVGVPSGNNDGFSCAFAPFPNLAPLAFDDDFVTPVNTPVGGNVLPDNGNGADNDPEGGPLVVNTSPLAGPSNGSVTLASDGSFTYTPAPNFIGTDAFEYQIIDETGLTATAVVTIVVEGDIDFTVSKSQTSGPDPATAAGDVLGYEITVVNTGDVPLTDVEVIDTLPDGTAATLAGPVESGAAVNTPGQLDVGETWTFTASYTVSQADMDSEAPLINRVAVTTDETGSLVRRADEVSTIAPAPSLSISKDVDISSLSAPGLLTYTIEVDNTGNQTLTGVSLTDTLLQGSAPLLLTSGPDLSGDSDGDGALDVSETWTYTATFDATTNEINDGGDIVNLARVDTDQTGPATDDATTTIVSAPAMTVTKVSDTTSLSGPGVITYQITVDNTGNVSLTGVTAIDTLTQGATTLGLTTGLDLTGDANSNGALDPDETWIYTGTYAVTQAQIDDGADIANSVTLTSDQGAGGTDGTATSISQSPAFTIAKSVDQTAITGPTTLRYEVVVTNTGNIGLTGGAFADTVTQGAATLPFASGPTLSGDGNANGILDVGEAWVYVSTVAVTQGQIDDGSDIENAASFTPIETAGLGAAATTTIGQTPEVGLAKAVDTGEPSSFADVGDTIDFRYTVTNRGNTTLIAPITIDDDQIGTGLACVGADLAPGASASCVHTWTADQADVDAGAVTNTATAVDDDGIRSAPQTATVTAVQSPALSLTKEIVPPVPGVFQSGEVLTYNYTVTNIGNVTFIAPITVDDNLTTVSCPTLPAGGLVPQGSDPVNATNSIVCEGFYAISGTDETLGVVLNVAHADTTFNGDPVMSPSDDAIFPVDAAPVLALAKDSVPSDVTVAAVGDTIAYSYTITNLPPPAPAIGAALTEEIYINDNKFGAPILCRDPAVEGGSFLPGESHVCTAVYTVTQDDLDAGIVENEATANTTFAPASPTPVDVTSRPATKSVPVDAEPALTLDKTVIAGASPATAGDVLSYQIVASNTGNQTLNTVIISDPALPTLTCDIAAPVSLAPGSDLTCTGSYTVTQADMDAQTVGDTASAELPNTASVNANTPDGDDIPVVTADHDHPLVPAAPAVTVVKSLFPDTGADPAFDDVGDTVRFRISVTNGGNMTLSSIDVTDSLVSGTCTVGPLAPGETDGSCIFDYVATQADLDAGEIENTGMASALPIDPGAGAVTGSDTLTGNGPALEGGLTLVKGASLDLGTNGIADVGDVISYTMTVTNSGNTTLSDIVVTDPGVDPGTVVYTGAADGDSDGDIDSLAPGTSATVTASFALTQVAIDAGSYNNSAEASGLDPSGATVTDTSDSANPADGTGPDDPTIVAIGRSARLDIAKSASVLTDVNAGETITYNYDVTNTGNVTLTGVTLTDLHDSAAGTAPLTISGGGVISTLAPGATASLTASYLVTQGDIDAGMPLTNEVTATATAPAGVTDPSATDDAAVGLSDSAPDLAVIKTVASTTGLAAGDSVVFAIAVENTGNTTLDGISLDDRLRRLDGSVIPTVPATVFDGVDTGISGALDVGETWNYTLTYVLSQDDVDAGGISNTVTVSGSDPSGTPVSDVSDNGAGDGDDPTVLPIPAMPSLEAVKVITSTGTDLGDTVTFAITLRNDGNVTLTSVGIASDTLTRADGTVLSIGAPVFSGSDMGSPAGTLQVGETATYSASYTLVQDDIDAGGIQNTATGQGTPPVGGPVTDISDDDGVGSDPTVLIIDAAPGFDFDKSLATGAGPTFDAVGDVLSYVFTLTNTGNVTLAPPFDVTDPLVENAGGSVVCSSDPIAPGAAATCTADYSVTQFDLDNGEIVNEANASIGDIGPETASETVPAVQLPALTLVKSADEVEAEDFVVGLEVDYSFAVTNTGNVTLTDAITIDDPLFGPGAISCPTYPAAGLAPGATYTCTATYTVTGDDVELANVTNNARATSGTTTSPVSTNTIPNDGTPALSIEKTLIASLQPDDSDSGTLSFDEVGDQLEYQFEVTNTGQVAFASDVVINDTLFDAPFACYVPSGANPDLVAGETITCTATYVITQDDLDAGEVFNEAYAETSFGSIPTTVLSGPDSVTTPATLDPQLTLTKEVDRTDYAALGEVVTYSFTVENTGNQSISNVAVNDPLLPGMTCEAANLAVGGTLSCDVDYVITQADIDRGGLINTATVTGQNPAGDDIPAAPDTTDSASMDGPMTAPSIALRKLPTPDPFGAVGSPLVFTFEVTNTSIFTLSDITISDPLPGEFLPYTCDAGSLAPGAVSTSCVLVTTVTQDMVDAGEFTNTATVAAEDPFGRPAAASDSVTVDGPAEAPAIMATKLVDVPATTLGSTVTYTLLVENPGNVSINLVVIDDQMVRDDGTVLSLDSPFVRVAGDDNFDGQLNPTEVWTYTASYTITQDDINAGGFSNTVTASGLSPSGTPVSDVSDDGDDTDGNSSDDATEVPIEIFPVLDVTKTVTTAGAVAGDEVIFLISAANVGNVDISDAVPTDTLSRFDGTVIDPGLVTITRVAHPSDAGDATLSPAEVWTWEVSYTLTQDDIDAGGLSNTATVDGAGPPGVSVSDVSDDGDPTDGNLTDDPTELLIAPMPALEATKTVASAGTVAGEDVVFEIAVANNGNVTLSGITFADTLRNADGTDLSGAIVQTVDGLTPEGGLAVGTTAIYTVTYALTQADLDSGGLSNTATVSGQTPLGSTLTDVSDDGDDADGNNVDDPTEVALAQNPGLETTKEGATPNRIAPDIYEARFDITVTNTGNLTFADLMIQDDLTNYLAPATLIGIETLDVSGFGGVGANPGYDGLTDVQLVADGSVLAPGETGTVVLVIRIDTTDGFPEGQNSVTVVSEELGEVDTATSETPMGGAADILASKTANVTTANIGDTVTYTLRFQNRLATIESNLTVVDLMPDGVVYTPGTARFDGSDGPEPAITGRQLTWTPVQIGASSTLVVTFDARIVAAATGEMVNTAYVEDAAGNRVSNAAAAVITRRPEPVFDCADVIGKVFDDRNQNGYQDGPPDPRAAITNQDIFDTGKEGGIAPEPPEPEGEPGLAGVRLSTVSGTLITTDQFGRFSVPCAELPADIGSNFQLKLDTRTLPSGYHMTTENPRSVRVTPGRMTRLNFGAALSNLVEIDLTAAAFTVNGTPVPALVGWLDTLVAEMAATPSVLRLTYYHNGEAVGAVNARLDTLEAMIAERWGRRDRYRLTIERTIHRTQ